MNIFKNKLILIGSILIIILLIVTLVLSLQKKTKEEISDGNKINVSEDEVGTITPRFEEVLEKQTEADYNFGTWQDSIQNEYLWYDSLPLQTDRYFVYFDTEKKVIIATIYKKDETAAIQSEIRSSLESLGVNLQQHQIIWE